MPPVSLLRRGPSPTGVSPLCALARGVSADSVHRRQPQPDTPGGSRVTYRGGISRSKGAEFMGRLLGRWRGTTIDVSFDHQKWSRHEEASRHMRFWGPAVLHSQTLRRLLFPDLALIAVVSASVVANNSYAVSLGTQPASSAAMARLAETLPTWCAQFLPSGPLLMTLPTEPFALSGFALGLLVTFRTQACHARYSEARLLWGDVINVSRDLGSRILCTVAPTDARTVAERERALRLLGTFVITLKYHVTIDGCNEDVDIAGCTDSDIQGAKDALLLDECACVWAPSSAPGACADDLPARLVRASVVHRPLFVLHELGALLQRLEQAGVLTDREAVQLSEKLLALTRAMGGCERLFRTPIYTPYNHHTSRFLLLWTVSLPAAMYPVVGPLATAPVSLLIAWMMLGIEDIGSRIENPMDTLPLWQYVDAVHGSLAQLRAHDAEYHSPAINKMAEPAPSGSATSA
ncbi:Bestrophin, RFP-TM, chloride channel-domain-containing protein [Pavlovales sp. CCMP2436]|nr:Bestrophin, RFP-TM, chloride channel-domain-containing protein [Pavlovales sp. CCMP2436]|mmetsp:Transcript_723/g.1884  ORF Transcript_723/g.1884 Transcript_723/m.1884 type:complete len:463 (-) Transcript_723:53-1441(-)